MPFSGSMLIFRGIGLEILEAIGDESRPKLLRSAANITGVNDHLRTGWAGLRGFEKIGCQFQELIWRPLEKHLIFE